MNVKYEGDALKIIGIIAEYIEKNPDDEVGFLRKTNLIQEGQAINKPKPLFKEISKEETEAFKERKGKEETPSSPQRQRKNKRKRKKRIKCIRERKQSSPNKIIRLRNGCYFRYWFIWPCKNCKE